MYDAGLRWHDPKVLERLLAPAQKSVTLAVALELALGVVEEGRSVPVTVHLHRVVDHQLGRLQRVDPRRVAAQRPHRIAHRRQVHHRRHAGEILQQHAGRPERDLTGRLRGRLPAGQRLDVRGGHGVPILVPQQVLEQDPHGVGGSPNGEARLLQRLQAGDPVRAARDAQAPVSGKRIGHFSDSPSSMFLQP